MTDVFDPITPMAMPADIPIVGQITTPRTLVAPPALPVPHKFGLFSAATIIENPDPHELIGVEYQAVCSTAVDGYLVDAKQCLPPDGRPPAPPVIKRAKGTISVGGGGPFGIYAADECFLGREENEARQQLRQRVLAGEQTTVERIVFAGSMNNYPAIQQAMSLIPAGHAGLDLLDAIGLLEQWLATAYGGAGILHVPRPTGNVLQRLYQVGIAGPRAGTVHGSGWVFGAGFPGTMPIDADGQPIEPTDDGQLWLYATPPITIRRSPLLELGSFTTATFNRQENVALMVEERIYVVDWPCGSAAVKVNLPRPLTIPAPNPRSHTEELWPQ